jgi:outer membrane protein W
MTLQLGDGGSYSPKAAKQVSRNKDPVDTGMIGISIGAGQVSLDDAWQLSSETTTEYSLGLYFSKALSARVSYSKAKLNRVGTTNEVNFESYSLDAQYYFFEENRFRPYLSAGFGENMFEKELENKYFQVNVGTGLHIKLNNNFAIQTDWRHYHSTISKTDDDLYSARIVYYFGQGER